MGIPTTEPNLTRYDLYNADECFLTGTGAEIVPVVKDRRACHRQRQTRPGYKELVKAYKELTKKTANR